MTHSASLDPPFLQQLIDAQLPEGQELEYKRDLPRKITDHQRSAQSKADPIEEFAKDVSAMANASGGILLFGVAEDPKTQKPTLHPIQDETYDVASRRLHDVLDRYVEPRLFVHFQEIPVEGGYVLAIRVPGSLTGPHWYGNPEKPGKRRFNIRRGTSVSEYTYQELRAAFDRNAAATARARDWLSRRLVDIKAGRTWQPLSHGPIAILHLVPLISYYQEQPPIDVHRAAELAIRFPRPWQSGYSHDINFDGYIIYPGQVTSGSADVALMGYTQLFRDGAMEVAMFTRAVNNPDQTKLITPARLGWTVHEGVLSGASVLNELGKGGPLLIGVSLMNTAGYAMPNWDGNYMVGSNIADRDDLIVPAAYVENSDQVIELERAARTALNMIWQGFGIWACPLYDEQGNYKKN